MITYERLFCDPTDSNDPYENIAWVREDAEILGADGTPVFSQASVEFPDSWSQRARNIVSSKYFYGSGKNRESSLNQLINRVVNTITDAGRKQGHFGPDVSTNEDQAQQAINFGRELKALLVRQYASFNSPVWFNIGVNGVRQQGSACFINRVEDDMTSILELSMAEGQIFKLGSGSGVNMSRLRGKGEPLSGGGSSSGPISFMKGLDAQAGIIKSGGVTRRAAKMVLMDIDHPDIVEFIRCKQVEEKKAATLIAAGYDSGIDGEAYASVFFQNANHSVRLSDDFMLSALQAESMVMGNGKPWKLRRRTDGVEVPTMTAHDILHEIAETAWSCGDPGVQFTDTINEMHTCAGTEPIYASNPCSEFVFLDNTACNLASINVLKYWDGTSFDWEKLRHTVNLLITAQDILVSYSDYPTKDIELMTKNTRPLGLGICNLGALLMTMGLPYDSDSGRDFAAAIMAVITGEAYYTSALLADELGPFVLYNEDDNAKSMNRVVSAHKKASYELSDRIRMESPTNSMLWDEAADWVELVWDRADLLGKINGYRNAQVTVIAPTGTISFMMDCDTTGMEPLFAPKTIKTLVGGGSIEQEAQCYLDGMHMIRQAGDYCGTMEQTEDEVIRAQPLLATALGDNVLSPEAHLDMLAALQPFVSGAISKTINMPADSTTEDVLQIIIAAWKAKIKCIAVYRDGSKGSQPLSVAKEETAMLGVSNIAAAEGDEAFMDDPDISPGPNLQKILDRHKESFLEHVETEALDTSVNIHAETKPPVPYRRKLNRTRPSVTHKFDIGGHEGYLTVGLYKNGDVAEIFVNMAKEGSTISGLLGQWAMTLSLALQYGVPLSVLIDKHSYVRYEPSGFTGDDQIQSAYSLTDYIMRWIAANAASFKEGKDLGKVPKQHPREIVSHKETTAPPSNPPSTQNGNICTNCKGILTMQGTCYVCTTCGLSTGCG